jgi:hypothetical protein
MSIDEQRSLARPDGRNADAPEVIGEAPTAAGDRGSESPDSFDRPPARQPVVWPEVAPTQPMAPNTPTQSAGPSPYGPQPGPQHTQPLNEPVAAPAADPWGLPTGDPWIDVTPGGPTTETVGPAPDGRGRRRIGAAVGLFAAGVLCGALVTGIFTGWGSNNASALSPQTGQSQGSAVQPGAQPPGQGQQGQQPGAGQGGQGLNGQGGQGLTGRDGEVRLVGTLTAVSGEKVTVKSAAGSATYTITSSTRILRNGTESQASDLHAGDVVLVHAFPSSSSDGSLELIYARSTGNGSSGSGSSSDDSSGDDSTT